MRIAITTLGCKINQYDSAVIQSRLEEKHSFVPFGELADCYLINTCTVTDRADWEARQLVRRAKRLNPAAKVLVTGCYAQVNSQEVAEVPGVDYVVGLNRLDDLLHFVESTPESSAKIAVSDVKREREVPDRLVDLIAASDIVCPHLHICAQAGDDEILKQMRRNYDTSYYRDLLARVRERLPEAALGSDIIVGFPGESDAQFDGSLEYF